MDFGFLAPWQSLAFLFGSALCLYISRKPLRNPRCHGFYRFFAFEAILLILILNLPHWHANPGAPYQLFSWAILAISVFCVASGLLQLKKEGGQQARAQRENFAFENTERLVSGGIFRFIRHPMYASLLLLTWGGLCKHLSILGLLASLTATLALLVTGLIEERENLEFFGTPYRDYMRRSKRFIPFIF
jgi:protein-S-isoprenylcysteine O-methyltransferase Ste14